MPNKASPPTYLTHKQREFFANSDLRAYEIETSYISLVKQNLLLREINRKLSSASSSNSSQQAQFKDRCSQTNDLNEEEAIDLSGYLIFVTKSKSGQIRLYGSASTRPGLQIGDEILEINDENVSNFNDMSKIIKFIHKVSFLYVFSLSFNFFLLFILIKKYIKYIFFINKHFKVSMFISREIGLEF